MHAHMFRMSFLAAAAAPLGIASAQCQPQWLPGAGYDTGFNGTLEAVTTWDPDADGPAQPLLIVGGSFRTIGGTFYEHIAAWDGSKWQRLGPGLPFVVLALTVYEGELIAAGTLNPQAGAMSAIARWDGVSWRALGSGVNAQVNALAVHNGKLYAGGEFTRAGELVTGSVAGWSGDDWHDDLGGGVAGSLAPLVVSLASTPTGLVVGGFFNSAGSTEARHIARWDGKEWHPLGEGRAGPVNALALFDGQLVAASHDEPTNIAAWDGLAWQPLGLGLNRPPRALIEYRGDLVATSDFTLADGQPANGVARWDGAAWRPLADGLGSSFTVPRGHALGVYANQLAVGGFFESAGGHPSVFFARWTDGADFNTDGGVTSQDFFDFLSAFFSDSPRADFNHDGAITSQDFFDFLGAFFGEC